MGSDPCERPILLSLQPISGNTKHSTSSDVLKKKIIKRLLEIRFQDHLMANSSSFVKSGVPYPVTGSQPRVAFQLAYGTTGVGSPEYKSTPLQPLDPPSVISLRP